MRRTAKTIALSFLLSITSLAATQTASRPNLEYTLTVRDPLTHLYEVEFDISGLRDRTVTVAMPGWTPGSYAVRDFARNVQQIEAVSRTNRPLSVEQIDKQTWRISKAAEDDVRLRYRVYSTSLTDEMADITPSATFMYLVDQTRLPVSVKYQLDSDWKIYTALEKRGDRFYASDYHAFIEAFAFAGDFKVLEVKSAAGVPYRLVFSNPRIQMIDLQVTADLEDLVNAVAAMFGELPFKEYTFLVRVQATTGAASLGRSNSGRVTVGENDFVNQTSYLGFLTAVSQSLVHAWYGSRIRPERLQNVEYAREAFTRLLWFTEGVAAYSADLLLLRAGILTPAEYYSRAAAEIDALQHQSGRRLTNLEDASLNAWTRGDNFAEVGLSYTLKGKIAGLLLDMEIRGRTAGNKSLDDLLRYLTANYAAKGAGIAEDAIPRAVEASTGINVQEFFDQVVRSRNELSYNRYLEPLGLYAGASKTPGTIQFGIEFERVEGNLARIRRVLPNSPASVARLDAGDIIIAMDSERVTFDNLTSRIHSKRIGRPVSLAVMRGERLLALSIVPAEAAPGEVWNLVELSNATAEQVRLRKAWAGQK